MEAIEKGFRALHARLVEIRDLLAEIRDGLIDLAPREREQEPPEEPKRRG